MSASLENNFGEQSSWLFLQNHFTSKVIH